MLTAQVGPTWRPCPLSRTTSNCTGRNLGPASHGKCARLFLWGQEQSSLFDGLLFSAHLCPLRETLFSQGDHQRPQQMRSGLFFCISYETLPPYSKAPIGTFRFATTDGWTRVARCLGDWIGDGALWRVVAQKLKLSCYTTNYEKLQQSNSLWRCLSKKSEMSLFIVLLMEFSMRKSLFCSTMLTSRQILFIRIGSTTNFRLTRWVQMSVLPILE